MGSMLVVVSAMQDLLGLARGQLGFVTYVNHYVAIGIDLRGLAGTDHDVGVGELEDRGPGPRQTRTQGVLVVHDRLLPLPEVHAVMTTGLGLVVAGRQLTQGPALSR